MDATARIESYRRRIARLLRRAEARPERAALVLQDEAGLLLAELKRLARAEPAVVLEVLILLLERTSRFLGDVEDREGFADGLLAEIVARIGGILARETAADARLDRARVFERLFRMWIDDADGHLDDLAPLFLELAGRRLDEGVLTALLRAHLRTLPLVFPTSFGAEGDLRKTLLHAERHRSERLLGEILAALGTAEYAVLVARDHHKRTGDVLDLVVALRRAGGTEEAILLARRALASPRTWQHARLRELLDEMVVDVPKQPDRETKRGLERDFLAAPSRAVFHELKRLVPPEQWPRTRGRLLGHLHKHQREPSLLFSLYLEEGEWLEADGLVATQPIDPDTLTKASLAVAASRPDFAAGWRLAAAHRRAAANKPALLPIVVEDLLAVRALARSGGQETPFLRALERFRARYENRPRLLRLLDAAGLVAPDPGSD